MNEIEIIGFCHAYSYTLIAATTAQFVVIIYHYRMNNSFMSLQGLFTFEIGNIPYLQQSKEQSRVYKPKRRNTEWLSKTEQILVIIYIDIKRRYIIYLDSHIAAGADE